IDTDSRPLYWEFPGKQRAIRYGGWKCVTVKKNAPLELYRIKEDPSEEHDLAAENPDVVKELDRMMHQLRTPSPNYPIDNE
ncbi:MAG: arylsulfatase, partial [Muribaculaceae bacterium]|nr:arylsulfatase [Muribaculaceae bacterium]